MKESAHPDRENDRRAALYVVATPIGNLGDVTLRALDVLKSVDLIAAEDTRVAQRLLTHYGIESKLVSLHEHNERTAAQKLIAALDAGKAVALVTDAGTPGISDPGSRAVAQIRAAGHAVVPVPGPNAAVCALSAAGIEAPHFLFYGFLPQQGGARERELAALAGLPYVLVFYEAPHRVVASVRDMANAFGDRRVTIARELTKLYETIHVCALSEAAAWLEADANRLKGEFVLLVEGAAASAPPSDDVERVLEVLLADLPLRQAVTLAVKLTGARKNDVYERALTLGKRR